MFSEMLLRWISDVLTFCLSKWIWKKDRASTWSPYGSHITIEQEANPCQGPGFICERPRNLGYGHSSQGSRSAAWGCQALGSPPASETVVEPWTDLETRLQMPVSDQTKRPNTGKTIKTKEKNREISHSEPT